MKARLRQARPAPHRTAAVLPPAFLLLLISCAPSHPPPSNEPQRTNPLSSIELRVGEARLKVEVARSPADRNMGLMHRRSLAPDSGMLFVFETAVPLRFWMKNTLMPLSIAFVDSAAIITDILEMAPGDTVTPYRSSKPARYAVEMNSGWFLSHGIKPGDSVAGLPPR